MPERILAHITLPAGDRETPPDGTLYLRSDTDYDYVAALADQSGKPMRKVVLELVTWCRLNGLHYEHGHGWTLPERSEQT